MWYWEAEGDPWDNCSCEMRPIGEEQLKGGELDTGIENVTGVFRAVGWAAISSDEPRAGS